MEATQTLVSWLSLVVASVIVYRLLKVIELLCRPFYLWCLAPALGWKFDLGPYKDRWTVVTGCTDGIGLAYTMELASRGFSRFVLISRDRGKLERVACDLKERYGEVKTKVYAVDFAATDCAVPDELAELDVGFFVHSCGVTVDEVRRYDKQPKGTAERMARVNFLSAVQMTDVILPLMVQRGSGVIVYLSSALGWRPYTGYLSAYNATKGGVGFLARCLHREFKGTNIKIQCLYPLFVATKLSKYTAADADGFLVVSARRFARSAVDSVGLWWATCGCAAHDVQCALFSIVPFAVSDYVCDWLCTYHMRRVNKGDG